MNRPDQPRRPAPRRTPAVLGPSAPASAAAAPQRRVLPNPATHPTGRRRAIPAAHRRPSGPPRAGGAGSARPTMRRPLRLANPGTRLRVGLFAVAFLLSLFAGRLLQLQGVEASAYATVADTERRITETLSATRGTITDRSGVPLATTIDSVNVFADQTQVENPALTARMLAPFVDVDVATLEQDLIGDAPVLVPRQGHRPRDRGPRSPTSTCAGIHAESTHRRTYPGGELGANILGFVDAAGVGQAGVEQIFDDAADR